MNRDEIVNYLNNLETRFPVNEWTVNGSQLWPVIKIDLFFIWAKTQDPAPEVFSDKSFQHTRYTLFKERVKFLLVMFQEIVRFLLIRKGSVMYFGSKNHRIEFDGNFINRYYEPLEQKSRRQTGKETNNVFFDYESRVNDRHYRPEQNLFFLDSFVEGYKLIYKAFGKKKEIYPDALQKLSDDFSAATGVSLKDYPGNIQALVYHISIFYSLFRLLFRIYKPQRIFIVYSYHAAGYALSMVSRELNIRLTEIQHGGLGILHPAYCGWNNCPENGYNVLPKEFWCWDENSAEAIREWTEKQQYHKVFVGGNPWIEYLKNYRYPKSTDKKIILYTLQVHELDTFILDAIEQTSDEYIWWLRLHPRKKNAKGKIEDQLRVRKLLKKVNLDDANTVPLPLILKNTSVHISKFSGSIVEAKQMGVKTIIIDPVGEKFFEKEIDGKLTFYYDVNNSIPLAKYIALVNKPEELTL